MKKVLFCLSVVLVAQVALASVTVDFTSVEGVSVENLGTLITLDFTVDSSGNVTLDASTNFTGDVVVARVNELDGAVGTVSAGFGQSFSINITGETNTGTAAAIRFDGLADAGLGVISRNPNRIEYFGGDTQSNVAVFEVDISSLPASDVFQFEQYTIGASINGPNADALVTCFTGSTVNSGTLGTWDVITNINTSDFWLVGGNVGTVSWEQETANVTAGQADGYGLGSVTFDIVALPLPPVTSGLVKHVDANSIAGLSDGDPVNVWKDLAGYDDLVAYKNRPTYKTGIINGLPVVWFGGSGAEDGLEAKTETTHFSGNNAHTVFAVGRARGFGQASMWEFGENGSTGTYSAFNFEGASSIGCRMGNGYNKFTPVTPYVNGTPGIFVISYAGGTATYSDYKLDIDGIAAANAANNPDNQLNLASSTIRVGTRFGPDTANSFIGDIAEIMMFNRSLNKYEMADVGSYLADKYGLSTAYVEPPVYVNDQSPADGQICQDVQLDWEVQNAQGTPIFDVYLSTDPNAVDPNQSPVKVATTTDTFYTPETPLEPVTLYYWRIDVADDVNTVPIPGDMLTFTTTGLVGQWQFEDDLTDSSGNGYDGTPVGTPVYDAIPADDSSLQVSGKALHCTVGGSDWVELPASVFDNVGTQVTISLWTWGVDQPNNDNQFTWIIKDSGGTTIAYMMIPHSTARIDTRMGNATDGMDTMYEGTSAPNSWFNGKWNHWVLTKDSETGVMRIYCNGELHYELTNATKPFYGAATFYVGGNNDSNGAFGGYIDDVRVYNYALTEEEIAAIHPRPMYPDPEDGQRDVAFDPTLIWTPGDGTSLYKVYIGDVLDSDPNIRLTDPIIVDELTEPNTLLPVNLSLETQYYWYVEEYDGDSNLVWTSDLWDFGVRELKADIDENSAVLVDDLVPMAGRWTDDVRGAPAPVLLDDGAYDPNDGFYPDDPANYAYYWQTYWTATDGLPGGSTGGNALYGTGYCEPVKDANDYVIAWHYDTPSSTGGTDTVMWYYHGDRPSAPIPYFDELRVEVKAAPGSVIKNDPYTYIGDDEGNWVMYTFSGITALLSDNQWHELVWDLRSIGGTASMGNFQEFDVGYWGYNLTGTFYFRNARLINNEGTSMCLPIYYIPEDLNFDCLVNLDDFAILAEEWLLDARNP